MSGNHIGLDINSPYLVSYITNNMNISTASFLVWPNSVLLVITIAHCLEDRFTMNAVDRVINVSLCDPVFFTL